MGNLKLFNSPAVFWHCHILYYIIFVVPDILLK